MGLSWGCGGGGVGRFRELKIEICMILCWKFVQYIFPSSLFVANESSAMATCGAGTAGGKDRAVSSTSYISLKVRRAS